MTAESFFAPSFGGYLGYCAGFCVRYFLIVGGLYCLLHMVFPRQWLAYRIQQAFPENGDVLHEIRWSMANMACTGLSMVLLYALIRAGTTAMYFDVAERGWAWFALSIAIGVAGYDAWFYWQHRLLHTPWLFRHAHRVHHHSTNPTPFATFAHHPIETFMGNAYLIWLVVLVPLHPAALTLVGVIVVAIGLVGHLGYEFYPRGFAGHRLAGWINTATHHNMHHSDVACNYGLAFQLWDRLMATNHAAYVATFDAVHARRRRHDPRDAEGLVAAADPS